MSIDLPEYVDPEAWSGFCSMRSAKGKRVPFTERAAKMILKTLRELHDAGHDANASLDQSTLNGWSDCYVPKDRIIPKKSTGEAERTTAYLASDVPIEVTEERRARAKAVAADAKQRIAELKLVRRQA